MSAQVLAASSGTQVPVTSFGHEPIWLTAAKVLFTFGLLVVLTLFMIVFERKVVAYMQQRVGPNRVGPRGYLQSLADGLKLALKEEIIPAMADKPVYVLAPVLSAVPAFLAFAVIPYGPKVSIGGHQTALQLTDFNVGVLWVLACSSLGVYGIVLAGWSSGSTYPLLGGLRSTAQVISYEVAMGLSFVAVFLYAGSMSTSEIVAAQHDRWFILTLPVSFLVYLIAMVGETNRAPFDLPEAESELVGGFHTEYTSLKFAMFFLAEYINLITVSALSVTMFLGGWRPFFPFNRVEVLSTGWFPLVWFLLKLLAFLFLFVWLRGTLPRLRYDQFMRFGWKVLIPVSIVWIMLVAIIRVLTTRIEDRTTLLLVVGGFFLLVCGIFALLPTGGQDSQRDETDARELIPVDQGGFPTPPVDLVVPPTPRSLQKSLQPAGPPEKQEG